jgi:hypothetical protein
MIAILLSGSASAQLVEGVMVSELTSPKMETKMTMTTWIKGDKSVVEMDSKMGKMKMFTDQTAGTMTMVMEAQKMGMVMDMKKMAETEKKMTSGDSIPPVVKATGEKQTISGHICERYSITNHKGDQSSWWMTDDVPQSLITAIRSAYDNRNGMSRGKTHSALGSELEKLFRRGLVPIRIESNKDGKTESTFTFIKFEKRSIDDSVFIVPSDIKIMQMPAGMSGGQ